MSLKKETEFDRVAWLIRHRTWNCPKCEPRQIRHSLIRTTQYCPTCKRIWIFRYLNPQDSVKRARRYWWFEDSPKERFII